MACYNRNKFLLELIYTEKKTSTKKRWQFVLKLICFCNLDERTFLKSRNALPTVNHKWSSFLLGTASLLHFISHIFSILLRRKRNILCFLLLARCVFSCLNAELLKIIYLKKKGTEKRVRHKVEDFTLRHLDLTPRLVKSLKDCCQSPEKQLRQLLSAQFSTMSVTSFDFGKGVCWACQSLLSKLERWLVCKLQSSGTQSPHLPKSLKLIHDFGAETKDERDTFIISRHFDEGETNNITNCRMALQ